MMEEPVSISILKRAARDVCPPVLWRAARRLAPARAVVSAVSAVSAVTTSLGLPPFYPTGLRIVRTTAELDREIQKADQALARGGDDAYRQAMAEFRFVDL